MIDLQLIQSQHEKWQKKNFNNVTSDEMFLGIVEEVGELSHALLKDRQGVRTNENHKENAKDAVGDILIYLIGFCTKQGWVLEDIIQDTWHTVSQRDWKKYPKTGMPTNRDDPYFKPGL